MYPDDMRYVVYKAVQVAWGFPQTAAGFAVHLAYRHFPQFSYHGAWVTVWDRSAQGLSLGPYLFVCRPDAFSPPDRPDPRMLVHEYGHSVQSLILGPLYLPLVGLPSVIWAKAPVFVRRRKERRVSYYSFVVERSANWLGERILNEPSPGTELID